MLLASGLVRLSFIIGRAHVLVACDLVLSGGICKPPRLERVICSNSLPENRIPLPKSGKRGFALHGGMDSDRAMYVSDTQAIRSLDASIIPCHARTKALESLREALDVCTY